MPCIRLTSKTGPPPVVPLPADRPGKVNGKPVGDAEYELAHAILGEFNRVAGTGFHGKDWIAKIVLRIREEPSGTLEQHVAVIERAFADPWWKGASSPSVVYGNARVFQQAVTAVAVPPPERGLTPEEIEQIGRERIIEREPERLGYVHPREEFGDDWIPGG